MRTIVPNEREREQLLAVAAIALSSERALWIHGVPFIYYQKKNSWMAFGLWWFLDVSLKDA